MITIEQLDGILVPLDLRDSFIEMYPNGVEYSKAWHRELLTGPLSELEPLLVELEVIRPLSCGCGKNAIAIAGKGGFANVSDHGIAAALNGDASAGYYGVAVSIGGSAFVDASGIAICDNGCFAGAGTDALALARPGGHVSAGKEGIISALWWCEKAKRSRLAVAYVGEDGILPNVPYKLDSEGNFIKT